MLAVTALCRVSAGNLLASTFQAAVRKPSGFSHGVGQGGMPKNGAVLFTLLLDSRLVLLALALRKSTIQPV